jgi:restriction system protein
VEHLDAYEILGIRVDATSEEIRAAYLRLSRQVHSDKGGTDGLFRQVKWAYDLLSDPSARRAYDQRGTDNDFDSKGNDDWSASTNDAEQDPAHDEPPRWSNAEGGNGGHAEGEVHKDRNQNQLQHWFGHNPSAVVLVGGCITMIVGIKLRSLGGMLDLLGVFAIFLGIAGLLGRRKAALLSRWRRADMGTIDEMAGNEFEHVLAIAFQQAGYGVQHVGGRGDFGADLILQQSGSRTVVQAKRWVNTVGPRAIQEVAAARAHYGAQNAIVVTNSTFTSSARSLARTNGVELWDRSILVKFISMQTINPKEEGLTLFKDELKAGLPRLLRGVFVALLALMAATLTAGAAKGKKRRHR